MSDSEEDTPDGALGGFGYGESGGDGADRVSLSEAIQAVEDVLSGCQKELRFLRRRLKGQEEEKPGSRSKEAMQGEREELPSPREQAVSVASRLESCAAALRNASTPVD